MQQRGDQLEERDIFKKPLSKDELTELAKAAGGVNELFSWKSPTARQMALKPGTKSDAELVDLMMQQPNLVRRPIIRKDGKLQLGFGKQGLMV